MPHFSPAYFDISPPFFIYCRTITKATPSLHKKPCVCAHMWSVNGVFQLFGVEECCCFSMWMKTVEFSMLLCVFFVREYNRPLPLIDSFVKEFSNFVWKIFFSRHTKTLWAFSVIWLKTGNERIIESNTWWRQIERGEAAGLSSKESQIRAISDTTFFHFALKCCHSSASLDFFLSSYFWQMNQAADMNAWPDTWSLNIRWMR